MSGLGGEADQGRMGSRCLLVTQLGHLQGGGRLLSCPLIVDPLPSPVRTNCSDASVELSQELGSLTLCYSDCKRQFCKHGLRQRHLPWKQAANDADADMKA